MKYVAAALLWLIGLVYLFLFLLFALLVSFIFSEETYDPWLKFLLRLLFKVMFIPVTVEGLENLEKGQTYLFMANHVSLFDVPLFGGYVPGIIRGIEASRQHRWPLYGWVVSRLGNIPIDRKNIHSSIRTIRNAIPLIRNGKSLIILPEGHRTLDGNLRPFKKLPFYFAKEAEREIVPVGISGLYSLKSKNSWVIRPVPVKIKFGKPVSIAQIQSMDIHALSDDIRDRISELVERP